MSAKPGAEIRESVWKTLEAEHPELAGLSASEKNLLNELALSFARRGEGELLADSDEIDDGFLVRVQIVD